MNNNMKNMVILKNLPSNIAEEALVILKPNVKLKTLDFVDVKKRSKKNKTEVEDNSKRYIVNEAEMVVTNYLSKIESQSKKQIKINKNIEKKYKKARITSICLGILLLLSFCF